MISSRSAKNRRFRTARAIVLALAAVVCAATARPTVARAAGPDHDMDQPQPTMNTTPPELDKVDIVEHLNGSIPLDATFRDASGKTVKLGDFFDGKRPVLFVFQYFACPMLCSLVLDATTRGLKTVAWTVGNEFDVVSLSIDPRDTPETATKKQAEIAERYGRGNGKGWHFLVAEKEGDETNIRRVADAVGFQFRYDKHQKQYAHPAAIYLLTPTAMIARYLYGIEYDPNDLKLGLLEASQGRSISTVEKLLLYCYHYDPQGKHYAIIAMRVMRVGGVITMVLLGGLMASLWWRERRRARLSPLSLNAT